jgi:hypothetical protein
MGGRRPQRGIAASRALACTGGLVLACAVSGASTSDPWAQSSAGVRQLSSRCSPAPKAAPEAAPRAGAQGGLIRHLAVLRRGARGSDLPRSLHGRLFSTHDFELASVAVHDVRYLGRAPNGIAFYLVPGTVNASQLLCQQSRRLSPAYLREIQLRTHEYGLALAPVPPGGQTTGLLYSAGALYSDVVANRLIAIFNSRDNRTATVAGVVPDGVVDVVVAFAGIRKTVRVAPGSNFWAAQEPGLGAVRYRYDGTYSFLWLDFHGRTICRFTGIAESSY